MCCIVFFFKQKTAYELRISDWSSDVCSSDLADVGIHADLLDAREVLTVRDASAEHAMRGTIDWQHSSARLAHWRSTHHARHVVVKIGRASCRERVCQYV